MAAARTGMTSTESNLREVRVASHGFSPGFPVFLEFFFVFWGFYMFLLGFTIIHGFFYSIRCFFLGF